MSHSPMSIVLNRKLFGEGGIPFRLRPILECSSQFQLEQNGIDNYELKSFPTIYLGMIFFCFLHSTSLLIRI